MVEKQTTCDWADLPVLLAVSRHGTLRGAAKALGVSHSTVLRRLANIEDCLGARMFDRLPTGRYELTPAGHDACETAQHVEENIGGMERRIHGRDLELAGPLLVTMPAALMPVFVRDVAAFAERFPKIELAISAGYTYADLAHREADVALRITPAPSPELVGRRLCDAACGVYGSVAYLATRSPRTPFAQHDFIGWEAGRAGGAFARWIAEHAPESRIRSRVTQDWQLKEFVDADLGLTILPCALGDSQPHWRRVKLARELTTPLWILSHRDLRATARVRAFRQALAEAVVAKRELLAGRAYRRPG